MLKACPAPPRPSFNVCETPLAFAPTASLALATTSASAHPRQLHCKPSLPHHPTPPPCVPALVTQVVVSKRFEACHPVRLLRAMAPCDVLLSRRAVAHSTDWRTTVPLLPTSAHPSCELAAGPCLCRRCMRMQLALVKVEEEGSGSPLGVKPEASAAVKAELALQHGALAGAGAEGPAAAATTAAPDTSSATTSASDGPSDASMATEGTPEFSQGTSVVVGTSVARAASAVTISTASTPASGDALASTACTTAVAAMRGARRRAAAAALGGAGGATLHGGAVYVYSQPPSSASWGTGRLWD